jgi:EAL domain-containing protein (putative c-di-GMP-specific phosphodiesterase class I)/DNA-binding response OmpR family regulator
MTVEFKQIFIIDDDEDYRNLIVRKLHRFFPDKSFDEIDPRTNDMPDENFCWDNIDLIILDYNFGLDYTGLDWFKKFKSEEMPATILMTAQGSEEIAVKAIKIGVDDYIVKGHFNDNELIESINECVSNKNQERIKLSALTNKSVIFNKSNFIQKLQLITNEKDTKNNLLLINPVAYQQIGEEKGINHQDSYIKYVTDCIYDYITLNNITSNIFIYREEYITVILETDACEKHINAICEQLNKENYTIGMKKYPCLINVGVISPQHFEESEFNKSDYALLSIALVLCKSAKSDEEKQICNYGDINVKEVESVNDNQHVVQLIEDFDIESAVADGRISANYQPWVYILSDDKANVKDIYDVRVEFIDIKGNKIPQQKLFKILDNVFAKRIVDRWVLKNTTNQLIEFTNKKDKQINIKLTVKITLSSIADPEFISWLHNLLIEANLPKGCLLFEIEASQFIRDTELCKYLIEEISREFDIKFILSGIFQVDTYYQIRELHIFDKVKLNIKILTFGAPRAPLQNLIRTIKNDGAKIIAVNVADAETLTFVTGFDVDYVHGYLVGKPYIDAISDSDGDLYCVI